MLINKIGLNTQGKLPTPVTLEAYDPELETCQQMFARRYPHHSAVLDALGKVESANAPVYIKVADSDPGKSTIFGLLPNLRCSF